MIKRVLLISCLLVGNVWADEINYTDPTSYSLRDDGVDHDKAAEVLWSCIDSSISRYDDLKLDKYEIAKIVFRRCDNFIFKLTEDFGIGFYQENKEYWLLKISDRIQEYRVLLSKNKAG